MASVMRQEQSRLLPYMGIWATFIEAVRLRYREYCTRPRYDDAGYVWARLCHLPFERNDYACGHDSKHPQ